MIKKIVIAGVVGGVIMFMWGAISHMVLGLADAGLKSIPLDKEEAVLTAMKSNLPDSGLYFFPGMEDLEKPGLSKEQTEAAWAAWGEKYKAGPYGILVYHPTGEVPMSVGQLLRQLLSDLLVMLLAACLLSKAVGTLHGYAHRVAFVTALGLLAALAVHVPYWNWYGFPGIYTLAKLADEPIGFAFGGLALAFFVKPSPDFEATKR